MTERDVMKKTGYVLVEFKDPDLTCDLPFDVDEKSLRRVAEFSEYFRLCVEVDERMSVISARFLTKREKPGPVKAPKLRAVIDREDRELAEEDAAAR